MNNITYYMGEVGDLIGLYYGNWADLRKIRRKFG